MVRYLSAAWFERLRQHTERLDAPPAGPGPALVLRQVVTDTPEGEVRYDVTVAGGRSAIDRATSAPADLTFTSDFATATAIASGRTSTYAALSDGRLRVRGDVTVLTRSDDGIAAIDPLPAGLRAETEF